MYGLTNPFVVKKYEYYWGWVSADGYAGDYLG